MIEQIRIPVLTFHSVRPNAERDLFAVDPGRFAEIVSFISERFGTLNMSSAQAEIDSGTYKNDGKVLITFDDGYRDNFEVVVPILERNSVNALFFLLPKYFGQQNLWNTRAEVLLDHLTVEQVRNLIQDGHTIGSHGLSHHRLTKFDEETVKIELVESRKILEDLFEVNVDCFAYPYGGTNPQVASIAKKTYRYSFATDQAPIDWSGSNFSEIRREFIWPNSSIQDVEQLVVNFGTYDNNPYKYKNE